ncbi:tetratricopeptide repeat protein [Staphylococcus sp. IVB6181]|uniref:tetratricopeptide repeat protein n=1 Tax=Staphylococcus sp. IVB6181 TaxID=2929481 RepID=UPI0021CE2864|nr:tetratricopeptide repeat protein [Staphylococcus sp. IVB6181]UXV33773.1 tetratricopeptide repeat protein [Staphylococcus sp. IVB6181]
MKQIEIYQLIKDGQFEAALKALFENIDAHPEAIENYINSGILLAEAGEVEKAEKFFQKALTIDPDNGAIYYNLANVYYNAESYNDAIKLYHQALQTGVNEADTNYMIGMSFNQLGDFKSALPFLMRAAELDQNQDEEIQFQYGLVLCHMEMFEQGITQLDKVLKINPKHTDALYNRGLAGFMHTEDTDQALPYFEKAVEIDPKHLLSQHAIKTFSQLKEEEE